ncbi:MAG: hypothetical protein QM530_07825 [Phycisphaerales bacterium]|nr:hypothetical protein [Phycisphaerales bacterium]
MKRPFSSSDKNRGLKKETLTVNLHKKRINGEVTSLNFVDKDTKQHVIYIPSLEISGYGETIEKAKKIVEFSINDFFTSLLKLSLIDVRQELKKLGWERAMFNKEFSHAYIDANGELNGFEAEGEIEKKVLSVA